MMMIKYNFLFNIDVSYFVYCVNKKECEFSISPGK